MVRVIFLSLLICLPTVAFAKSVSPVFFEPDIAENEVHSFLKRWEQAQASEVFKRVESMIHPDALFRFGDGDFRGIEAIRGAFEATWAHDVEEERYWLTDIVIESVDRKTASVSFTYNWSGVTAGGPFDIKGRGSMVIVREGPLKIKMEHLGPPAK